MLKVVSLTNTSSVIVNSRSGTGSWGSYVLSLDSKYYIIGKQNESPFFRSAVFSVQSPFPKACNGKI